MDTDIDVTFEIHGNPACWLSTLTAFSCPASASAAVTKALPGFCLGCTFPQVDLLVVALKRRSKTTK